MNKNFVGPYKIRVALIYRQIKDEFVAYAGLCVSDSNSHVFIECREDKPGCKRAGGGESALEGRKSLWRGCGNHLPRGQTQLENLVPFAPVQRGHLARQDNCVF